MISSQQTDQVYIGSTKLTLERRFAVHKCEAKTTDKNCRSKVLLNEFTDCRINLIEYCSKENKVVRERYWVEQYGNRAVNKFIPGRSSKEYKQQHSEQIKEYQKEYQKEYYQQHTEQIKEQKKEYRQEHAEQIKEKSKEYKQQHTEQIKEYQKEYRETKITCECGAVITQGNKTHHLRTKKHTNYLASQQASDS
jgi:hypothetical protein